jgi:hypothetical protein
VFAGTVDDPFWIDLGAAFDSLNFRNLPQGTGIAGVLTPDQDADDTRNFAADDVAGFNVNAIAIEVPIELLTYDGKRHAASDPLATIGTWGTTSRPRTKVYRQPGEPAAVSDRVVQIQRMGNPLFNELIIGTGDKDKFSMSQPQGRRPVRRLRPGPAAGAGAERDLRRCAADSRLRRAPTCCRW